jgi:DNA-binding CsgD family transcriptional regulator
VLRLIAEENANKEIAAQLSINKETVNGQVRNIIGIGFVSYCDRRGT